MIVVFPISTLDQDLAEKNVKWWNELGGCKGHEVLFITDDRCQQNIVDVIGIELSKAFDKVHFMQTDAKIDGWPEGANYFFRVATCRLQDSQWPYFFWMEADAIPMKPGWLDTLDEEYKKSGRKFMGDRVQVEDIPLHMSGVGFYPNPIYNYAGEAYRAHDIAWDMAASEQIVPQAYFTKLIEHAWKHPTFHHASEIKTQIRPECVLFHSSKDGSLIDLLRQQKGGDAPCSERISKAKEISEGAVTVPSPAAPVCDIFIRTYPADYQWIPYCLQSLHKYAKGFRKIWIISPKNWDDQRGLPQGEMPIEWKTMNDETPDGYLAQQITKLYADVITGHEPDYILHIDSDVFLRENRTPQNFFKDGKIIWLHTPWWSIQTPWQPITEKFMGRSVEFEFMRRFPLLIPKWLYPKLREFCFKQHGMPLCDYVKAQPEHCFSEYNALGAYAWQFHHDQFYWVNTTQVDIEISSSRQFRSYDGITPEVKKEIDDILRGTGSLKPGTDAPAHTHMERSDDAPVPSQIKALSNGVWVIEGDTHVSKWIEQEGRLDHDQNSLPVILPYIKEGDTVVDAGAFVGDHTIAYSQKVGENGIVYAFEPNPIAFQCLKHNTKDLKNVLCINTGLGDKLETVPLSGNNYNAGGAYVGEHMKIADVKMEPLDDSIPWGADFIKIDAEGCEVKILKGAREIIESYHPTMVIEVNEIALRRQGHTVGQLYALLESHGYENKILQENCCMDSPLYDIVARHNTKSPEVSSEGNGAGGLSRCTSTPPPVRPPLTPYGEMIAAVVLLKNFAEKDSNSRLRVMMNLSKAGLTPRNPRKKKHAKTIQKNKGKEAEPPQDSTTA